MKECGLEGHDWALDLSDEWLERIRFLRKFILVPVVCRKCGAKGTEYWVLRRTAENREERK